MVFWWAMFRLLKKAGHGDVQWAVYGVLIAIFGTHLGFYSRSFGSESLAQTFLAVLAVWVLTRKQWRILDALVVGCLAAFLAIVRWQLLLYAIPLFGAMYYRIWKARGKQGPWATVLLVALPLILVSVGLAQVGLTNRWMTGDFLRSPYSFGDETFRSVDFARPELAAVLLHPWHGLLSYHPLYLLGFIALLLLVVQSRSVAERLFYIGFILVIVANVYLQAAWYAWWLGTVTFGMRGLSISAVVLIPAIVRYMRERERRGKPNLLFGFLVLAACLWSLLLLLANLDSNTQFMTYSGLLGSSSAMTGSLLPALLVLSFTLIAIFLVLRIAKNASLVHWREVLTFQLQKRLILSISLLILFPIGVFGLIAYILSKHSGPLWHRTGLSVDLAIAIIPLGVVLILLFLSTSASFQTSAGSLDQATVSRQHKPNRPVAERLAIYLVIGLFVAANAMFVRLARHVEAQIATHSAPTDQIAYVSPVRVDEVESSYCEYLNVPGFEAKKEALRGFVEELKACRATRPTAERLPQCLGLLGVDRPLEVTFEPFLGVNRVTLTGGLVADGETSFRAGDIVGLTTYWNVLKDSRPLKFSQRLQDSNGWQWVLVDYWPEVGCQSVESWQRGETHVDRQGIRLPPDLPPGKYEVVLAVYSPETGIALPAGDKSSAPLAEINVLAAVNPPETSALNIPMRLDIQLSDELALLGYEVKPNPLRPESDGMLRVWWTALNRPTKPYQVRIELLDDEGHAVSSSVQALSSAPTDTWQDGQIVSERYPLTLDQSAASGDYRLRLSLIAPDGIEIAHPIEIGVVTVLSRSHAYELPTVEHPLDVKLGQEIALRGYTLDRPAGADNELHLTLYWQAMERVTGRYRVFLHVVDDSGHIVAQNDEDPAAGAAPTQTWLAGEVVTDTHVLNVPSGGPYQLLAGLYDAATGQRLPALDEAQQPVPDAAIPLERVLVP